MGVGEGPQHAAQVHDQAGQPGMACGPHTPRTTRMPSTGSKEWLEWHAARTTRQKSLRSCHDTDGGRPDTMTRNSDRRRSRGAGPRTDMPRADAGGAPYLPKMVKLREK